MVLTDSVLGVKQKPEKKENIYDMS